MLFPPLETSEMTDILRQQILSSQIEPQLETVGFVLTVGDGTAQVWGLGDAQAGELLVFSSGIEGIVMNLWEDRIGVIILGDGDQVKQGDSVRRTGRVADVPVGTQLLGRVVDALGNPLDGKGALQTTLRRPIENLAPGVMDRRSVHEPLQTGVKSIDGLIPIGRGQRELVIGDRQTGKTTLAIDTILNQRHQAKDPKNRVVCIYVAIGQKRSKLAEVANLLEQEGALDYTILVAATASDASSLQFLAPYAAMSMGEYFRDNGQHALIVLDDLSKHAVAYREMSLLLRRPPGREAYPGDIFYLHARLLERAAQLNDEKGGGSLTAIPIVETQAGDVSAYVPTNIISITDGQIFLESDLFYRGIRPAINLGISVSRVGGAAQSKAMRSVSGSLKLEMAQYKELSTFSQFLSDLDPASQKKLNRGHRLMELLKQPPYQPLPVQDQIIALLMGIQGDLDDLDVRLVQRFVQEVLMVIKKDHPEFLKRLDLNAAVDADFKKRLKEIVHHVKKIFV